MIDVRQIAMAPPEGALPTMSEGEDDARLRLRISHFESLFSPLAAGRINGVQGNDKEAVCDGTKNTFGKSKPALSLVHYVEEQHCSVAMSDKRS